MANDVTTTSPTPSLLANVFEGMAVRHVTIDDKAWFSAADICEALGLAGRASIHTKRLDPATTRVLTKEEGTSEVLCSLPWQCCSRHPGLP